MLLVELYGRCYADRHNKQSSFLRTKKRKITFNQYPKTPLLDRKIQSRKSFQTIYSLPNRETIFDLLCESSNNAASVGPPVVHYSFRFVRPASLHLQFPFPTTLGSTTFCFTTISQFGPDSSSLSTASAAAFAFFGRGPEKGSAAFAPCRLRCFRFFRKGAAAFAPCSLRRHRKRRSLELEISVGRNRSYDNDTTGTGRKWNYNNDTTISVGRNRRYETPP